MSARPSGSRRVHAALVLAVLGVGVLLRALRLGGPAFSFDEFYDVFVARSILAGEGHRLPTGAPYDDALLATYMTAGVFALFGEGEAQARLPALVFGVLTLGLTYITGRALFGAAAGLVALLLLALSPDAIDVDRYARFYSPLTFSGLLSALAAFRALEGAGQEGPRVTSQRLGWLAVAAGAGLVAAHLQPVALGLVPVVQIYAAVFAAARLLRGRWREAALYGAIALGILIVEAAGAAIPGVGDALLRTALSPRPWYRPVPGDTWLYHLHLVGQYGWLWYAVCAATVLVVLARPRPGLFAALAFWVPFVLVSGLVATKAPRYIAHALPFAWLLVGGAAEVLYRRGRAWLAPLGSRRPVLEPRRAVAIAALLLAAGLLVRFTPSVGAAIRRPFQTTGTFFTTQHFDDWRGLARALGPRLEPDAVVVSGVPLAITYYLDRPSYRIVRPDRHRGHKKGRLEEGRVQRAAHLAALRGGDAPVWVIVERWRWQEPGEIDPAVSQMLVDECRAVRVQAGLAFLVFACDGREDRAGGREDR